MYGSKAGPAVGIRNGFSSDAKKISPVVNGHAILLEVLRYVCLTNIYHLLKREEDRVFEATRKPLNLELTEIAKIQRKSFMAGLIKKTFHTVFSEAWTSLLFAVYRLRLKFENRPKA